VLEFDLYHSEELTPLADDEIISRLTGSYLAAALPPAAAGSASDARVEDAAVLRFRGAATLFSPGSAPALPRTCSGVGNVFVAGDAVAQGPGSHGAKGLSQEKAYVTGLLVGGGFLARGAAVMPGGSRHTFVVGPLHSGLLPPLLSHHCTP
jgi:uncharacterized protein with NAD-binding domain and iron-sulfur cluster